ncbi:diguanylate cyclase domain-containing protein [Cohnella panacarvi]|uniref:diguanylate cyclase domain-containing protein n=1 Tax=Cohnella panacarvi TaxID=400776 RepID=UPI00047BB441|nr:diguanylate cyclase [Cohnella panacarvi]
MLNNERRLVVRFLQFILIVLLGIYAYVTYPLHSHNAALTAAAVVLFVYASFRKAAEGLVLCAVALAAFGGYLYYLSEWSAQPTAIGWNELIWLFVFPALTLLGALPRASGGEIPGLETTLFGSEPSDRQQSVGACLVDDQHGYTSTNAFLYKVEERVIASLRDRSTFRIVLVQIEHFREFKLLFGIEQATAILNAVAEWFAEVRPETKAQVGESLLAGVIAGSDPDEADNIRETLTRKLFELQMTRPRRESSVKLKLRFGFAECPGDGIEARSLMEQARTALSWSSIESPESP